MALSPELKAAYELVLKDLESEKTQVRTEVAALQRRLRELDQSVTTHRRKLGLQPETSFAVVQGTLPLPLDQKYAFISVHWAILHLLSEASGPMTTAEIADALMKAGVKTRAANFVNNVSAVLSANMRPKGEEEVELLEGKWRLTEVGRSKIAFIVASPKFRRSCPWIADSVGAA